MDERQKEKEMFARGATGDAFRGRHRWADSRNPNSELVPRVTKAQRWLVVQSFLSSKVRAAGRVLDPKDIAEVSDS